MSDFGMLPTDWNARPTSMTVIPAKAGIQGMGRVRADGSGFAEFTEQVQHR